MDHSYNFTFIFFYFVYEVIQTKIEMIELLQEEQILCMKSKSTASYSKSIFVLYV